MSEPAGGSSRSIWVVIVTFNRSQLLTRTLDGLAAQTLPPDRILVIDNASGDDTQAVLHARDDLPLQIEKLEENTGGAGGFHRGMRQAYESGADWIWLMDDDVVPDPECLERMLQTLDARSGLAGIAVRQDLEGRLVEKAAVRFDLSSVLLLRPKRSTVDSSWGSRRAMPPSVPVENVAFEGFLVHRSVVGAVGFPDPQFFIFYDDVDFALRVRAAGHVIWAVRDAVMRRQLTFDQTQDLRSWKGFFMLRNLFVVHMRHGGNPLVRARPVAYAAALSASALAKGRPREARMPWAALRSARSIRTLPPESVSPGPGSLDL